MALKGFQRLTRVPVKKKQPLTREMLEYAFDHANRAGTADSSAFIATLLMFCLGLRCGEAVPSSAGGFDAHRHLTNEDVNIDGRYAGVRISMQKNSQFKPQILRLRRVRHHRLDPVAHLQYTLDTNHNQSPGAPLFQNAAGGCITRTHIQAAIRRAAGAAGRNPTQYTPHSARIGFVNALLAAGYTIDDVKPMGRWRSRAVWAYVRCQLELIQVERAATAPRRSRAVAAILTARLSGPGTALYEPQTW